MTSRRDVLRTTTAAGATLFLDPWPRATHAASLSLYSDLLRTWCDRLLELQIDAPQDPTRDGALRCPACDFLHGRCHDAAYPLLHLARVTGERRYLDAALRLQRWSDNVSDPDGAFRNELDAGSWRGITVFAVIALAEALHHHGAVLDPKSRTRAFTLADQVLDLPRYRDRGRALAHASLAYLTPGGLLFGEGHPQQGTTRKHCRAVDLGDNVEESLPALALYGLVTQDDEVIGRVVDALRAHLRNLEQLAACTHAGLLHGGPHYDRHGVPPCVHHTFTHAKALATVLDRGAGSEPSAPRVRLPRDEPYGLRRFPEIGTWLASLGEWRATVTEYDWEYQPAGGGHPSGGPPCLSRRASRPAARPA
jgi:hypothetical protein